MNETVVGALVAAALLAELVGAWWGARGLLTMLAAAVGALALVFMRARVRGPPRPIPRHLPGLTAEQKQTPPARRLLDRLQREPADAAALRELAALPAEALAAEAEAAAAAAWTALTLPEPEHGSPEALAALRAVAGAGADARAAVAAACDAGELVRRATAQIQNPRAFRSAAQLLGLLAEGGTSARTELADEGGFELLAEGMREHEESAEEQQWGAWACFHLAFEHPGNKVYGAQRGALAAVVRGMDLHGEHRGLVDQGVAAVANFLMDAEPSVAAAGRPAAQNVGAVNTLSNALAQFPDSPSVAQLVPALVGFLSGSAPVPSSSGDGFDVRGPEMVQMLAMM